MPIVSNDELSRRRSDIIDAARGCFAQYGYEGATVTRLEKATGKTRGAIFHHFGDKESLFLAVASEDARRQAEVVADNGLIEVMRTLVAHPEAHSWYMTRAETVRKLRTDPAFEERWRGTKRCSTRRFARGCRTTRTCVRTSPSTSSRRISKR